MKQKKLLILLLFILMIVSIVGIRLTLAVECTVDSNCYPEGFVPGKCGTFYTCSGGKCYQGSAACPLEQQCKIDSDCGKIQKCGMTWQCIEGTCHQLSIECPLDECTVDSNCYPEGFVPGKCGTFYTCSGGKCYQGSAACPISVESGMMTVSIQKISEDKSSIKTDRATAITSLKLTIEGQKLYAETSVGNKQIDILPGEVSSKTIEQGLITTIRETELKEESQKLIYSVKGTKQAKLLFVIPVSMQIETKVSAESGNVISIKKPWWSFLTW